MQNVITKTDVQKKIPESVIFHPYHFRKINKSSIIKKLKAKQLKYRIKEALKKMKLVEKHTISRNHKCYSDKTTKCHQRKIRYY